MATEEKHGSEPCEECGGSGYGPDRIDGPGDVYQNKCDRCDGTGIEPDGVAKERG